MFLVDILSIILHFAELCFAAIVAGLTGRYLHAVRHTSAWDRSRFIYTEVVAALSIVFSIIWLFPFSGSFLHYPVNLILSVLWFVSFGLIVSWLNGLCGYVFNWNGISFRGTNNCATWKADEAFTFLSAICWLASGLLGAYWVHRRRRTADATRRGWYRSRV